MNVQESHLVCLPREQGCESHFPTLWRGTGGQKEEKLSLGGWGQRAGRAMAVLAHCGAGISGARAMQIGTLVSPTH